VSERKSTARRKPWLAALLSVLQPGLGQLYNGQVAKGLLWFFALLITLYICLGLMFYAPLHPPYNVTLPILLLMSVYVAIIRDAVRVAKQQGKSYALKPFNKWYVYLAVLLFSAFVLGDDEKGPIRAYGQAFKIPSGG
jgi:signal peptidase I